MRRRREARRRVCRRLRARSAVVFFRVFRRRSLGRVRVRVRPRADAPSGRAARGPIRRRLRRVDHRRRFPLWLLDAGDEMPLRVVGRRRRLPFAARPRRLLDAGGVRGTARSDGVRTDVRSFAVDVGSPSLGWSEFGYALSLWPASLRVFSVAPSVVLSAGGVFVRISGRSFPASAEAAWCRVGSVGPVAARVESSIADRVRDPRDGAVGGRAGDRSERRGGGGVRRRRRRRVGASAGWVCRARSPRGRDRDRDRGRGRGRDRRWRRTEGRWTRMATFGHPSRACTRRARRPIPVR